MAIVRINEIRKMTVDELQDKLIQLRMELSRELAAKRVPGKTFNAGKLKDFRRAIAKVLTVINANKKKEKKAKPANKKSSRKN